MAAAVYSAATRARSAGRCSASALDAALLARCCRPDGSARAGGQAAWRPGSRPPQSAATEQRPDDDCLSERSTASGSASPSAEEEEPAAARAAGPAAPMATLFVLDWDDTIMPTTWLTRSGCLKNIVEATRHWASLVVASDCIAQTLGKLKQMGRVVIVTNAEEGWVQQSAVRYLPRILPLLWGVEVISARTRYEKLAPREPTMWKRLAFEVVVGKFCKQLIPGQLANIISVGDMSAERDALFGATEDAPDCWGKSLKFQERPTLSHLVREHLLLQNSLEWLVEERGDMDLSCQDRNTDPL